MKNKLGCLFLSIVLVSALILTSCASTSPRPTATTSTNSTTTASSTTPAHSNTSTTAANGVFNLSELEKGNSGSQIVVISDMHLGVDDTFAEIKRNRAPLVDFLTQIRDLRTIKELVVAGDLIDEWFLPMNYVMPPSESAFVDKVAANNSSVITAFNKIISDGKIKVTYIPGNHDILVTAADIERILPGINQARDDVQGLGAYVTGPNSEIAIEHGHRYNFFCAPDPISNRGITQNDTSVLPPGYFFTRIGTSSVVEGFPASDNTFPQLTANQTDPGQYAYVLYGKVWAALLAKLTVNESYNDKVIKTNIDGFTADYAINDLLPQQDPSTGKIDVGLYKGIQDNWDKRQELDGVTVNIPLQEAILKAADAAFTDDQAKVQYFDRDPSKRIVVFGHTHVARLDSFTNPQGQKCAYANSGTWIDNSQGQPDMTFVVINLPAEGSPTESVNVYQYAADKTIKPFKDGQGINLANP